MKIRWLEHFRTVAAEGSITRAAWKLDTSQAALSRVIRDLEEELGVALFQRTGRGMILTPEGERILEHADRIVTEFDNLIELVRTLNTKQMGNLKIHLPLRIGRILVRPFVERFDKQFPMASAEVFETLNKETQTLLSNKQIDIGIYYSPIKNTKIAGEKFACEDLYVVGAPSMLGNTDNPISMEEAANLPLLMQSPPSTYRSYLEHVFETEGHRLRVVRNLNTIEAHIQFAMAGEGATVLAYSAVHQEVAEGDLLVRKIVSPGITRDIFIGSSSGAATLLQREAISLLKTLARENRDMLRWKFGL